MKSLQELDTQDDKKGSYLSLKIEKKMGHGSFFSIVEHCQLF